MNECVSVWYGFVGVCGMLHDVEETAVLATL